MWNEIYNAMGCQYIEDEERWKHFKKFLRRGFLRCFWTPFIWLARTKKSLGLLHVERQ